MDSISLDLQKSARVSQFKAQTRQAKEDAIKSRQALKEQARAAVEATKAEKRFIMEEKQREKKILQEATERTAAGFKAEKVRTNAMGEKISQKSMKSSVRRRFYRKRRKGLQQGSRRRR